MTFMELAEKRYAVKNFDEKPVDEEKLQAVLKAAQIAPTAKNSQCFRIYVLKSEEALKKVDEVTICRYHAPVVLLFTYDRKEAYVYPGSNVNSGAEDCAIAASHAMLEAADLDLGTCWVNRFNPAEAKKVFDLPEEEEAVLFMDLGTPSAGAAPLPNHTKKKALSELVKVL